MPVGLGVGGLGVGGLGVGGLGVGGLGVGDTGVDTGVGTGGRTAPPPEGKSLGAHVLDQNLGVGQRQQRRFPFQIDSGFFFTVVTISFKVKKPIGSSVAPQGYPCHRRSSLQKQVGRLVRRIEGIGRLSQNRYQLDREPRCPHGRLPESLFHRRSNLQRRGYRILSRRKRGQTICCIVAVSITIEDPSTVTKNADGIDSVAIPITCNGFIAGQSEFQNPVIVVKAVTSTIQYPRTVTEYPRSIETISIPVTHHWLVAP